ncbi:MAG: proline--tRNA ligase [Proteobacteria bacterium]|nr:proline--tRNA ligase [Pseudomonadota bacterium]
MRQTQFLIPTLKEDPADADVASHRLMLRSGLIRQLASGLYTWLPLGVRVLRRIEKVIREELNLSGAQEVLMPVVQPAELWRESKRWDKMGPEMMRMQDRHQRDFCLGPTHEEVITDLFRREIQSYRQLPVNFYQIQTKFRDEVRPRFGVMRAREFTMKDGYSFHLDQASFDETYKEMHDCYSRILTRLQLDFRAVDADTGNIGGSNSHEFHVLTNAGEDTIAFATQGSYAANLEKAVAAPPAPRPAARSSLTKVPTPGQTTIEQVARHLNSSEKQCVKTLIVKSDDEDKPLIALVLRGDHELNTIKAQKLEGVHNPLEFADPAQIKASIGCDVGSIGPVGLDMKVLVDPEAAALADFICGANEDGYHTSGVNWVRDVALDDANIRDMRNVVPGDPAPDGQGSLDFLRGIEVGHIFQLGTVYSEPMQASVLNENGRSVAPIMGCYGMGVTRLVAAVIEQNHDDQGICWPRPVAPFQVHILALNYAKSDPVRTAADTLLDACNKNGIEALLDDRPERPGVKFADADLIGLPFRLTIGDRGLAEGNVEFKVGRDANQVIPVDNVMSVLMDALSA